MKYVYYENRRGDCFEELLKASSRDEAIIEAVSNARHLSSYDVKNTDFIWLFELTDDAYNEDGCDEWYGDIATSTIDILNIAYPLYYVDISDDEYGNSYPFDYLLETADLDYAEACVNDWLNEDKEEGVRVCYAIRKRTDNIPELVKEFYPLS